MVNLGRSSLACDGYALSDFECSCEKEKKKKKKRHHKSWICALAPPSPLTPKVWIYSRMQPRLVNSSYMRTRPQYPTWDPANLGNPRIPSKPIYVGVEISIPDGDYVRTPQLQNNHPQLLEATRRPSPHPAASRTPILPCPRSRLLAPR